jgi:xanthine dehydrogenase accessory factor
MEWLEALRALQQAGKPAVLVTVLAARGSTPREAGCKMVVCDATTHGTIGGGNLEFQSVLLARTLLAASPDAPLIKEFPLGPALGQCCGGHASVLFEPIRPAGWHVALFGAGHVGRALVGVLGSLECRVTWIDSRDTAFPPLLPANAAAALDVAPATRVPPLPAGTYVLVMTHDHALDFEIVAAALPRADLPFVGLIGSETKRARFVARLARQGMAPAAIRRLVCPIGVPGAGGKAPAEIAIAVAAQLLQTRDAMAHAPAQDTEPVSACSGCGTAGCAGMEVVAR